MAVIRLRGTGKSYPLYAKPADRLWELITGKPRHTRHTALYPIDLEVLPGDVLGIIGRNGAGKSTLLKLIAGTIQPSSGTREVSGQISALLELGTGFHPDLTGRENVYLAAAVRGLSAADVDRRYDEIVAFADIGDVLGQPVKTYSSGMLVRLAFSVATCTDPEVLIVDEALSVGDSAFAHKSFERIMGFKRAGKTILFCSHSMYQVEAICNRVIWIEQGRIQAAGDPSEVIPRYHAFLDELATGTGAQPSAMQNPSQAEQAAPLTGPSVDAAQGRIDTVRVTGLGTLGRQVQVLSGQTDVHIDIEFISDPNSACPRVAVTLSKTDDRVVASAGSWLDGHDIPRDTAGRGRVRLTFPQLPLLKGTYLVNVFLLGAEGIRRIDSAKMAAELIVRQVGLEQGVVSLPRVWSDPGDAVSLKAQA